MPRDEFPPVLNGALKKKNPGGVGSGKCQDFFPPYSEGEGADGGKYIATKTGIP